MQTKSTIKATLALALVVAIGCVALVTMPQTKALRDLVGIGQHDEKWLRLIVEWSSPRTITITTGGSNHVIVTKDFVRSPVVWKASTDPNDHAFIQAVQSTKGLLKCRVLYGDEVIDHDARLNDTPGSIQCSNPPSVLRR